MQNNGAGSSTSAGSKTKKGARKICACCAKVQGSMKQCVRCKSVYYCSVACQDRHWPEHKKSCLPNGGNGAAGAGAGAGAGAAEGKEVFVARTLEEEACAICLEIVTNELDFQLPCGHWYHRECVKQLRAHSGNESCPLCREPLPPGPEEACDRALRLIVRGERAQGKGNVAILMGDA